MIQKLKALKRCQAVAALVKDYTTACWSANTVHWDSCTVGQNKYEFRLFRSAPVAWIWQKWHQPSSPSVTADVQLETFPKAAASAYECLDFVSVRHVPQKLSYPAKKFWWVLPARTKLGAVVCPPVLLQCTLQKVYMPLDLTNRQSILLIAGNGGRRCRSSIPFTSAL